VKKNILLLLLLGMLCGGSPAICMKRKREGKKQAGRKKKRRKISVRKSKKKRSKKVKPADCKRDDGYHCPDCGCEFLKKEGLGKHFSNYCHGGREVPGEFVKYRNEEED